MSREDSTHRRPMPPLSAEERMTQGLRAAGEPVPARQNLVALTVTTRSISPARLPRHSHSQQEFASGVAFAGAVDRVEQQAPVPHS